MKTKSKNYLIGCFSLFVVAYLAVFLICPILKDLGSISTDIALAKQNVLRDHEQEKSLDEFKQKLEEQFSYFARTKDSVVDIKNPIYFIKFLEDTSADSSLDIDINLFTRNNNDDIAVFHLITKGSFEDTLAFVEKLETGPYMASINRMTLKKIEEETPLQKKIYSGIEANIILEALSI